MPKCSILGEWNIISVNESRQPLDDARLISFSTNFSSLLQATRFLFCDLSRRVKEARYIRWQSSIHFFLFLFSHNIV